MLASSSDAVCYECQEEKLQRELTHVDPSLLCKQKANCHERHDDCTAVAMKAALASEEATYTLNQA